MRIKRLLSHIVLFLVASPLVFANGIDVKSGSHGFFVSVGQVTPPMHLPNTSLLVSSTVRKLNPKWIRFLHDAFTDQGSAGIAILLDEKTIRKIELEQLVDKTGQVFLLKTVAANAVPLGTLFEDELKEAGIRIIGRGYYVYIDYKGKKTFYPLGSADTAVILPQNSHRSRQVSSELPVLVRASPHLLSWIINYLKEFGFLIVRDLGFVPVTQKVIAELTDGRSENGFIRAIRTGYFDAKEMKIIFTPVVDNYTLPNGTTVSGAPFIVGVKSRSLLKAAHNTIQFGDKQDRSFYTLGVTDFETGLGDQEEACEVWMSVINTDTSEFAEVMRHLTCKN